MKQKIDAIVQQAQAIKRGSMPYHKLLVTDCVPNDWNPNRMQPLLREKLERGIQMVLDAAGVMPPIVVRPHPTEDGKYQIIDGFHRWDVLRTLKYEKIDAYVLDVDTRTAMILTDTLNYLRGEPAPEDHAKYFQRLLNEGRMTPLDVSQYVPETAEDIVSILENYDLKIEHIEVPTDGSDVADDTADDPFLEAKFSVSRSQMEVIERELARIGAFLEGKNVRGRALEFMAVNSANTPVDNLMGAIAADVESEDEDEEAEAPKKLTVSGMKKKLKRSAS